MPRGGRGGTVLFYLAVAPEYFATIIGHLGKAGLIQSPHQEGPWTRVVIEKPFGHDLKSARALNRDVSRVLDESQVYRIDHYLGKETVQNILALRFGNSMFEPVWNRRHVASVQITVAEEVGMAGGRGAYYDTSGALRDMVQNHMMQLLCLVAMEPPVDLSADAVRNEKVKVLQALPHWGDAEVASNTLRGQYIRGSIQGGRRPRLSRREGDPGRLADGDLCRDPPDAQHLAMGGGALLPPDREAAAEAGDGDRDPVPADADGPLRARHRGGRRGESAHPQDPAE
jgi:glucose-6-phosphate 1-dehydrogenase